jgi:hypothetical protein
MLHHAPSNIHSVHNHDKHARNAGLGMGRWTGTWERAADGLSGDDALFTNKRLLEADGSEEKVSFSLTTLFTPI